MKSKYLLSNGLKKINFKLFFYIKKKQKKREKGNDPENTQDRDLKSSHDLMGDCLRSVTCQFLATALSVNVLPDVVWLLQRSGGPTEWRH